jgi:threonine dehydrogenase-like Zn-dependent dehydrogenase
MRSRRLDVRPVVQQVLAPSDAPAFYADLLTGRAPLGTAVIRWRDGEGAPEAAPGASRIAPTRGPAPLPVDLAARLVEVVWRADLQLGHRVCVIADEPSGLSLAEIAAREGAVEVVVITASDELLRLCRSRGVPAVGVHEASDPGGAALRVLGGACDVIFEGTGAPEGAIRALELVSSRGKVVLCAARQGPIGRVDLHALLLRKSVELIGYDHSARPGADAIAAAQRLIAR